MLLLFCLLHCFLFKSFIFLWSNKIKIICKFFKHPFKYSEDPKTILVRYLDGKSVSSHQMFGILVMVQILDEKFTIHTISKHCILPRKQLLSRLFMVEIHSFASFSIKCEKKRRKGEKSREHNFSGIYQHLGAPPIMLVDT